MRRALLILFPILLPIGFAFHGLLDATIFRGRAVTPEAVAYMLIGNGLWMGAPHLLFGSLALWRRSLQSHVVPVLWCLSLYLVCFTMWVWTQFTSRDAAFVWIAYLPGSLVVLLVYGAFANRPKPDDQST